MAHKQQIDRCQRIKRAENMETENKIEELLRQLTLEEKLGMIHGDGLFCTKGVKRLHIPPLKMSDGPMGVRNEFEKDKWIAVGNSDDYVTYLPSNSALASTWNRELAYRMGQVLGEEARGRGKDVILAPGINIKRSPLCGRNFEYMSEDPYLTKEEAVPLIQGIQESDAAACVKHFALNNQETERLWVDVEIGERPLREIYLPAFYDAVKRGGAYSLMGAYNKVRGEHCCQSHYLLDGILREEWNYDGTVISDWGAVHDTSEAAASSLDIEMSVTDNFDEYCLAAPLYREIQEGRIEESSIDNKVRRILRMMERLHMLGGERKSGCYNTPAHRQMALETARESIVLLKNEDHRLPLQRKNLKRLLIIGDNGDRIHSNGGGSAEIKALYEISPLMGLKSMLGGNTEIKYVRGYCTDDKEEAGDINWQEASLNPGNQIQNKIPKDTGLYGKREELLKEAVKAALEYEEVLFIGGLNHDYDVEGYDRGDMILPYGQDEVIQQVLKANPNTVVILSAGAPVEMKSWVHETKALVWNWYAGMEGGSALAEVLLGEVNPSGRLPETFPQSHLDCPAICLGEFPGKEKVHYREGIYVGYRYYDTYRKEPQFCFGYGLSYTEFTYCRLQISQNGNAFPISVCIDVRNSGEQWGKEVVQLYVRCLESKKERPYQELKGYEKVFLNPGKEKRISFLLDESSFHYYDEDQRAFCIEPGRYEIRIGKSSRDICQKKEIQIEF